VAPNHDLGVSDGVTRKGALDYECILFSYYPKAHWIYLAPFENEFFRVQNGFNLEPENNAKYLLLFPR